MSLMCACKAMKILILLCLSVNAFSQQISEKSRAQLDLIDAREAPVKEALQKVIDAALLTFQQQRNAVVVSECRDHGMDAAKGECSLDIKTGTIIDKRPKPPEAKK